ncbi:MAG: two-component system C4-dicarboxylate transport response regulator DctD [Congregibacter sp.]|jgi:two-component system C4-dicarboxylate transport response regulator DctD
MIKNAKVIIVDDDEDLRHALTQSLSLAGYDVDSYGSGYDALNIITRNLYGVIITDIKMPAIDGLELLLKVLEIDPALPTIVITGHGDISTAVNAMRNGAYDFIEKPFAAERLVGAVARGLEKRRLVLENRTLRNELASQEGLDKRLVGRTPAMLTLRAETMALAQTDVDILVWGETGSGKEVVARALHEEGSRSNKPFVALNCGAIPIEMMESELFGHECGAFTSANKQRVGKLEYANGGTIFLDEIESMPLELQVKLLRVIETRSIERLGSNKVIDLDIRFIAATKTDLEIASQKQVFRADLYYRLNVVTLTVPPLRERKDDIPLLLHHLARDARTRYRKEIPEYTSNLMRALMAYEWPGNVRELRNIADRWVLGLGLGINSDDALVNNLEENSLSEQMATIEKQLIEKTLEKNGSSIRKTYEQLKLSRKALYEKMKKHQIQVN